ncbi:MAG: hypothetical protein ACLFNS_10280 [Desulfobacterales bacterium]
MLINKENLKLLGDNYETHHRVFDEFMDKISHLFINIPSLYFEFLPDETRMKYLGKTYSFRHHYNIEEKTGYLTIYCAAGPDNIEYLEEIEKYQFKTEGNARLANSSDPGFPWNMLSFTEDFFYQLIDNIVEYTIEKERQGYSRIWRKL